MCAGLQLFCTIVFNGLQYRLCHAAGMSRLSGWSRRKVTVQLRQTHKCDIVAHPWTFVLIQQEGGEGGALLLFHPLSLMCKINETLF